MSSGDDEQSEYQTDNLEDRRNGTTAPDRPYECSFCEKKFIREAHVKSHELIHIGDLRKMN